jgi:uncharacterized protein YkwD
MGLVPALARGALLVVALLSIECAPAATGGAAAPRPAAGGRGAADRSAIPAIDDPEVRELVRLVNAHRRRIGCRPLGWDRRLARVARRYSESMSRGGFFDHRDPRGRSPFDRLRAEGIGFTRAAENLAQDERPAAAVLRGWLASPGHRRNLENCSYLLHGVGREGDRWTHVFIRP